MIYVELKNYITQISSAETVDLFDNAVEVFDKYEMEEYMFVFEKTIGEMSEKSEVEVLDALMVNLRTALEYLLQIQGIVVVAEATISQITKIADGLYDIIYFENKQLLSDICSTDETDAEKASVLLALVIDMHEEEILSIIETIEDSFVPNFKERLNQVEKDTEVAKTLKENIAMYIKFKDIICKKKAIWSDKFLTEIASISLPFEVYIKQYKTEKVNLPDDIETIAKTLLGIACISCDAYTNPIISIKKVLNDIYSDLNFSTSIDIQVSKFTTELTRE